MDKILVKLFGGVIESIANYISGVLTDMLDIVFKVEEFIVAGTLFNEVSYVDYPTSVALYFDTFYSFVFKYAVLLLVLKFTYKILVIYAFGIEGDASVSPLTMFFGFIKALIFMICFSTFYDYAFSILKEFNQGFLNLASMNLPSVGQLIIMVLDVLLLDGLFSVICLLVFVVCFLLVLFQFMERGIQIFLLRVFFPFSCIGLLNSDGGSFYSYIKIFIQNGITTVVQLFLLFFALGLLASGHLFFSISAIIDAVKSPKMLQQYVIQTGGNTSTVISSGKTVHSFVNWVKKG